MNGDTRLYWYENTIELTLNGSTLTVDNRPMNNRKLKAHKGVTNEIVFNVRDRDRKLQNLFADTVRAHLIDPVTGRRIVSRILDHTADVGILKLCLQEGDLANIEPGLYQLYIARSHSESIDRPIYTDQDNNVRFDIEITDQTGVHPIPTQLTTEFIQKGNTETGDDANSFVSSALFGNLDRNFVSAQHTLALFAEGYTGQVIVQGSCMTSTPNSEDTSSNWFNVETLDIADPQTTGNVVHTTFNVNCNWVRIVSYPESGSISKLQLRN